MKDFEKNLENLEEIIEQIENGETLANSLELYKNGIVLIAETADGLNKFASEIEVLRIENGELKVENYTEGI